MSAKPLTRKEWRASLQKDIDEFDWDAAYHGTKPWVGLTDEEISAIDWKSNETLHDFARAVEAKLKEKNSG